MKDRNKEDDRMKEGSMGGKGEMEVKEQQREVLSCWMKAVPYGQQAQCRVTDGATLTAGICEGTKVDQMTG